MNQKQRRALIAEKIKIRGSISSAELAEEFGISKMTIGRDLKELQAQGVIELFHGGALYKNADVIEYPMSTKSDLFITEKKRIGKSVAEKIPDGSSVFLETGTTVLYAALELVQKRECDFYTNSLSVMSHLSKVDQLKLYSVPGKYRALSNGFLGMSTQSYLEKLSFDYCIIGAEGIDSEGRVSLHNEEDALTKIAVMNRSKQKLLVFDRSKIGKSLLHSVGTTEDFDLILTDYPEITGFFSHQKNLFKNIICV